jgi:hypothetical protein
MRRTLSIGIGAGSAALAIGMAAGVAAAAPGASHQATRTAVTAVASKHITRAQARRIAEAKVPHSRAIEVESDDLHDRPVWKVTLATPHGRVKVDVDKRTGKATILGGGSGGGRTEAALAASLSSASDDHGRDGRDDHGRDDHRRDRRHHRDRHDRDRHDRDRHDRDRDR